MTPSADIPLTWFLAFAAACFCIGLFGALVRRNAIAVLMAIEIMLNSPLIADLIFKGEVHEIKEIMKKSRELGMQTFDQHLFDLYDTGVISYEDALRNADSVNDLRLSIKLHSTESKNRDITKGIDHLNIV